MNHPARALAFLLLLASPGVALAHSPIKGLNNFYNGLLHPVFVPAHLLLMIALGLFLGQQGPKENQPALAAFLLATIAGLTTAWFSPGSGMEAILLVAAAAAGLLIAINPRVGLWGCAVITTLAGFLLGMDSAQESLAGRDKLAALFGSGIAIYFLTLYPMALADRFNHKAWHRIGVRIVGSWIAASALLVLALSVSSQT
jgi:hydrogenase/urease accessory protein HupE